MKAKEYPEITDDIEIRYKWYKEVVVGDYYPLKDITDKDNIDITKIKYGTYSKYDQEYCKLSSDYYSLEETYNITYKKLQDVRYILIQNLKFHDNIKIYSGSKLIDFEIISIEENQIKIDLKSSYLCENILFYIDTESPYKISLYKLSDFKKEIISKEINNQKIVIPDKTWITKDTVFVEYNTKSKFENSDFTTKILTNYLCRYREKYVYKYETKIEYYDNNYYSNVEGYLQDVNDYQVYYKGEPIINTIEIINEKIVKVPQIEYRYIENEKDKQNIDSSKKIECPQEIKTQTIEKEIFRTPKKIYIILILLILTIIVLLFKLYKKYVDHNI